MDSVIEPDGPIYERFADTIDTHSNKVAFKEVHPDPSIIPAGKNSESLTFRDLDERTNRIANKLVSLGLEKGDIVSYQIPNWIEFPLVNLAVQKVGGVSNPILTEHRSYEVGFIVDLCESDVLIIPSTYRGFDYVAMVEDLIAEGEIDPTHVIVIGEFTSDDECFKSFGWLEDAPATPVESPLALDDLEQLMFTSGTTGEPKGVRQTARVGFHQTVQPTEHQSINDSDVIFAPSPLAHNTGYHYFLRMGLLTGAQVVLFDKWVPSKALQTIAEEKCTYCMGATTFLKDLLDLPAIENYTLPHFRLFALGGSTIPHAVVEEAYKEFENITVMTMWGQTENGIVTATAHDDSVAKIAKTDGRPLPGCEITVRKEYNGEEVRNEQGKLLMRGTPLMQGYHRRPKITDESFTDDGWFKTGDLAILYDDNYISIEGREKDIIVRGGENISAPEVEEHVLEHPGVTEVAVVAMPDERLQERPCAYISLAEDYDADVISVESLSEFLDDQGLQKHKHPERIELIESFPRTSTGKIQKFKLRDRVTDMVDGDTL